MKMIEPKYLTIRDAARFSGISESKLYKLSSLRAIPRIKIGSKVLFKVDEFEKWLDSHSDN